MYGHLEVCLSGYMRLMIFYDINRWMFDCCRIPGLGGFDWSVTYAKPGDEGTSGHVVVLRKGRFWKLEPWIDGRLLSVPELEKYIFSQTSIYHNFDVGLIDSSNIYTRIRRRNTLQ